MKPGIHNDSTFRAYPFIQGGTLLPNAAIVDFGCLVGLGSGYEIGTHKVYLYELRRAGDTLEFEFRSDAPGLFDYALVFTRDIDETDYTTQFVQATRIDGDPVDPECADTLIWEGYLVTGELAQVDTALPSDVTISGGASIEIEPALIQSLAESALGAGGGYVNSISLANANRTIVTAPDDCRQPCFPGDQGEDVIFVGTLCMTGSIRFSEGYNCLIQQDSIGNSLTLGAQVGSGAGEPCEEVPLFEGEQLPTGSSYFTGGPGCNEVLRSINGVGGRMFNIVAGQGARVTPVPASHKVIVDVDMHQLAICHAETVSDTSCEQEDTYSDSSCDCGPA